jgi:group II intron reverse transcriptase/maturase
MTHVNEETLKEAYNALEGSKALGVDGISKKKYGEHLDAKLKALAQRVQRGTYRPQPKREVLIPKAKGKKRPIAIACFEDKLVDWVVSKILTQLYEPLFIRNSFGYRPNKSADEAIKACYYSLCKNRRKHVVEIDFSNFFNTIPHRKLMKIMGRRISDRRFKGLIGRFLKGELISTTGEILPSDIGTPQGSVMSPILANIYLDEVIDHWFLTNYGSYNNIIVRYADDAVFFFKNEEDAKWFNQCLKQRVEEYGLQLNEDKTHTIVMDKASHAQFNFLGFTFYWGKQGSRRLLKVKTQKEKLIKSIREFEQWIKKVRNQFKLKELWALAKAKVTGHINYFGYRMNALKLNHFYSCVIKSLYKWLNRRSQKRSYDWEGFRERLKNFPLMKPWNKLKLKQLGWNPYA